MEGLVSLKLAPGEVEDVKLKLLEEGRFIRECAVTMLSDVRKFRVGVWNSCFRKRLHNKEKIAGDLYELFRSYDKKVSTFTQVMSSDLTSGSTEDTQELLDEETRARFNIYASQVLSQHGLLHGVLQDLSNALFNHRTQANNNVVMLVALFSLLVAFIALIISV